MNTINVTSAPKTATFQMRINPEVKQRVSAEKDGWVSEEDAYRTLGVKE